MTNFNLKMMVMILMGLLMGAGYANVVPQNTSIFYDNDTLLAPNSRGEMTLYTIVEPTWEVNIPGVLDKTVNVTGAADKVIEYISVNFPHYRWSNVDDLDPVSPEKTAQDGPVPNCRAFQQAPYATADICRKTLKQIGNHYFKLGAGPGTCAQAECRTDFYGHQAAIWWCNDGSSETSATAGDIADMAGIIMVACAEWGAPHSWTWTRGQLFDQTGSWNVIVNGGEKCR